MDEPVSQQAEPEEQIVTPSEVWDQLSPEIQSRVSSLLARMAYKYILTQLDLPSDDPIEGCKNRGEK